MLVLALPARFPLRFLIAVALGVLHALSFVDDATWPIEIAALAGLVALVGRAAAEVARAGRAAWSGARLGFAFGLGWFLTGVSWIYISLHTYGEMNPLVAGAAVFAFSAYLSLYPALACAGSAWFRRVRPAVAYPVPAAVFAASWALSEMGRGWVFTGFPWVASGYAHVAGPLAGYAPLIGVYGVSMLAAAIAAALALAARSDPAAAARRSRRRFGAMLAMVFGLPLVGSLLARIDWTEAAGPPISVRLLQGNVAQDIKFDESHFDSSNEQYLQAIEAKRADLIVLPETAFPVFLDDLSEELGQRLARDARDANADIAFGIPIREGGERYFNSVVAIGPEAAAAKPPRSSARPADTRTADDRLVDDRSSDAKDPLATVRAQRYDKSHLVPFGEFIPRGFHWFVRMMKMPLGDFTRGSIDQKPMTLAGRRIAFNVCYEDLFGEEIIRQARDADILVNVSNVAWFGDSMALPQHLDISRMRSIETGRPMLRSTNTGMTASIDPHGRVLAKLAPFTVGSLDVSVQGMQGATPYLRFGNGPVLLLIAAALVFAWRAARGVRIVRDRSGIDVIDLR